MISSETIALRSSQAEELSCMTFHILHLATARYVALYYTSNELDTENLEERSDMVYNRSKGVLGWGGLRGFGLTMLGFIEF